MLKHLLISSLVVSSVSFAKPPPSAKPSSNIPEKREFPLNTEVSPCEDFHAIRVLKC